jgi:hypothetical protein
VNHWDQFDEALRHMDGKMETLQNNTEPEMKTDKHMQKLLAVILATGDAETLEQGKTMLFQWLMAAKDEDMAALRKLSPLFEDKQEAKMLFAYRQIDLRGQLAVLGAVESVAYKDKTPPQENQSAEVMAATATAAAAAATRGRHNFFGRVNNVADSITQHYVNGKEQPRDRP